MRMSPHKHTGRIGYKHTTLRLGLRGMEWEWNMGRVCTNIEACHQAARRKVGPLVSRQASGTHGSYNSRHDCIFFLQPASGCILDGAASDQRRIWKKVGIAGRLHSLSIPSSTR
jgi:hypothetical protein